MSKRVSIREMIEGFKETEGNFTQTAKLVGVSRSTLKRWVKRGKTLSRGYLKWKELKRNSTKPLHLHYKISSQKQEEIITLKETAFGIIPRSKLLKLEIEGVKKGLDFIYGLDNKKDIEITPEFILKLHRVCFAWIFPDWAGKYRKIQVTFSGKEASPYHQLPEFIVNLCGNLKERIKNLPGNQENTYITEVVKILAWFQHQFVFIHLFNDYNGRIARLLTLFILLKIGLPPVEIKAERSIDRKKYLLAMQEGDLGNLSQLENLISQALSESLEKLSR